MKWNCCCRMQLQSHTPKIVHFERFHWLIEVLLFTGVAWLFCWLAVESCKNQQHRIPEVILELGRVCFRRPFCWWKRWLVLCFCPSKQQTIRWLFTVNCSLTVPFLLQFWPQSNAANWIRLERMWLHRSSSHSEEVCCIPPEKPMLCELVAAVHLCWHSDRLPWL